jgi:hypothetical protein
MKDLRLERLTLDNFKGIRHFTLIPSGSDASVYGANATGKTTLADALQWMLFGKDSSDRADFEILPIDRKGGNGGCESSVEAELTWCGEPLTLRRTYAEKWTRRRGDAQETCTGHESGYYIDGVPTTQTAFRAKVEGMIPESLFRAITSPRWFCSQKWQDRRKTLLDMCGGVVSSAIFEGELEELRDALGSRTVEAYRKVLQADARKQNAQLAELPARLDEAQRTGDTAQNLSAEEEAKVSAAISELARQESALSLERMGLSNAIFFEKQQAQRAIDELDSQNLSFKRQQMQDWESAHRTAIELKEAAAVETRSACEAANEKAYDAAVQRAALSATVEALRAQWKEEKARAFDTPSVCPTCGQAIPADRLAEAQEQFEITKAARLAELNSRGKHVNEQLVAVSALEKQFAYEAKCLNESALQSETEAREARKAQPETSDILGYAQERANLESVLASTIARMSESQAQTQARIADRMKELDAQLNDLNERLFEARRAREQAERIIELKTELQAAEAAYTRTQRLLTLCDTYQRRWVEMTEGAINGRFALVHWKLFEEQVNGGIADCCTACVNGVPYGDLNNAMKVNAGLDIINALNAHYGAVAPVVVDNAESVTELIPMNAQVIRLVVDADASALRVEVEQKRAAHIAA